MNEYIDVIAVQQDCWLVWYDGDEPKKRLLDDHEKEALERLNVRQEAALHRLFSEFRGAP